MFKKKAEAAPVVEEKKEKPTPAYLREDYPYKAVGEPITDLDSLVPNGVLYVLDVLARSIKGTTKLAKRLFPSLQWHNRDNR